MSRRGSVWPVLAGVLAGTVTIVLVEGVAWWLGGSRAILLGLLAGIPLGSLTGWLSASLCGAVDRLRSGDDVV